jgi:predicted RNase H-like HicB family nuclease
MIYAAKIDQTAPDCFEVSFPDKPNAFTFGVSLEDALGMAKDCIETALEADLENGVPLKMPKVRSAKKGLYPIEIDPHLVKAYQLFEARSGKSAYSTLAKIASALGKSLEVRFVGHEAAVA